MAEVKGAYVRRASGLVREMSPFQAFVYCFLTLGLYTITQNLMYSLGPFLFPGADIGLGILTGAIVMVFIYAAYSMLASAMPRSGGDYVFQSRVLHPGLGFTSTAPMWVIWQFFYLGWYGFMLVSTGVSPFLLITGTLTKQPNLIDLSTWSWSADGQMVIATILLLISFAIAYKGMKFYIKAQTLMFILEIIGAAVAIGIVISVSRETFIANFNSFMANYAPNIPDFYHYVIKVAGWRI